MMTLIRRGGSSPAGMRSMFMMAPGLHRGRLQGDSHFSARAVRKRAMPVGKVTVPIPAPSKTANGPRHEQGSATDQGHPGHLRRGGRALRTRRRDVRARAPALRASTASRCRCSRRPRCSPARSARPPTSSPRRCTPSRTAAANSLTLRPEFTAGICRAYLTDGWQQHAPLKLATHGPVFRYERPQKGRYRQFHQLDAEIIGAAEPQADVELLVMADQLLQRAGHRRRRDAAAQHARRRRDAATPGARRWSRISRRTAATLSEDSQERLEKNPLRILDSKDPRDRPIADAAPTIDDFLTGEAARLLRGRSRAGLDAAGVAWTAQPAPGPRPRLLPPHRVRVRHRPARRAGHGARRRPL